MDNFIMDEFNLDAPERRDPIVAYMTSGFDKIPDNYNIVKESAIVNGFNLRLMMSRLPIIGCRDVWYTLIFTGPLSIVDRFTRFYFDNDKDVTMFQVLSISKCIDEWVNAHTLYADDNLKYVRVHPSMPKYHIDLYPEPYEVDKWSGEYYLKESVDHDSIKDLPYQTF